MTILLFDGECGLCDASVRFVRARAPAGAFRFVPLGSPEGRALLARHGIDPSDRSSLVVVKGNRAFRRSDAALLVAEDLRRPWRMLRVLRVVPRPLRDRAYDFVARHRHRLIGDPPACPAVRPPPPGAWSPAEIGDIPAHLGAFPDWALAGGRSLDHLLGRKTREHGDTDVGVFRSDLRRCLESIGPRRVFLASAGALFPWDGSDVPEPIHDVWVTDPAGERFVLQIVVYDDDGDAVLYRRDPRVRWPKVRHSITVRGVRIVNPLVTLLFKANRPALAAKDALDLSALVEGAGFAGEDR